MFDALQHPFLKALPIPERERLLAHGRLISYRPGRPLLLPGTVSLLLEGTVKVRLQTPRGTLLAGVHRSPFWWGEDALLTDSSLCRSIRSLEPCQVWALPVGPVGALLCSQPLLLRAVAESLASRLAAQSQRCVESAYLDLEQRLQRALLEYAEALGAPETTGWRLRARLSHRELAEDIGGSREAVARTMARLHRQGRVLRQNGYYVIPAAWATHPEPAPNR